LKERMPLGSFFQFQRNGDIYFQYMDDDGNCTETVCIHCMKKRLNAEKIVMNLIEQVINDPRKVEK